MEGTTSITERIAKAALAGILAFGLMLPTAALMAQPEQAYATAGQTVTITNVTGNDITFKAYQVFKAEFAERSNLASSIVWNGSNEDTVLTYLRNYGEGTSYLQWLITNRGLPGGTTTGDAAYTNASADAGNAAAYIAAMIGNTAADTGAEAANNDVTGGNANGVFAQTSGSFSKGLADALNRSGTLASGTWSTTTFTDESGYYLILADTRSIGATDAEAGMAPVWFPLGGATNTITAKSALPTLTMQVKDNDKTSWTTIADTNATTDLDYRILGKLPANLATFPSYKLVLEGQLGEHLVLADDNNDGNFNASDFKVYVIPGSAENIDDASSSLTPDGALEITPTDSTGLSVAYDSGDKKVTVTIANVFSGLKTDAAAAIAGNAYVAVYYKAHLAPLVESPVSPVPNTVIGGDGNESTAKMTYTADPVNVGSESSTAASVQTFAYQISLHKYSKSDGTPLAGAKFTVQDASNKYVKNDGTLVATSDDNCVYTTDASGLVVIPFVDAATYTITETEAPSGYGKQADNIELEVLSTLTGSSPTLAISKKSGGESNQADTDLSTRLGYYDKNGTAVADGSKHVKDGVALAGEGGSPYHVYQPDTGNIDLMTVDPQSIVMPLTGMSGYMFATIVGLVLVVGGGLGLFFVRRRSQKKEAR